MKKIMCAALIPCQSFSENGEISEYKWIESNEVEGAIGWESAADFVIECLDDVEIVENPSFAIHNLPENAVIVTAAEGEEGHNIAFEIYWVEQENVKLDYANIFKNAMIEYIESGEVLCDWDDVDATLSQLEYDCELEEILEKLEDDEEEREEDRDWIYYFENAKDEILEEHKEYIESSQKLGKNDWDGADVFYAKNEEILNAFLEENCFCGFGWKNIIKKEVVKSLESGEVLYYYDEDDNISSDEHDSIIEQLKEKCNLDDTIDALNDTEYDEYDAINWYVEALAEIREEHKEYVIGEDDYNVFIAKNEEIMTSFLEDLKLGGHSYTEVIENAMIEYIENGNVFCDWYFNSDKNFAQLKDNCGLGEILTAIGEYWYLRYCDAKDEILAEHKEYVCRHDSDNNLFIAQNAEIIEIFRLGGHSYTEVIENAMIEYIENGNVFCDWYFNSDKNFAQLKDNCGLGEILQKISDDKNAEYDWIYYFKRATGEIKEKYVAEYRQTIKNGWEGTDIFIAKNDEIIDNFLKEHHLADDKYELD